MAAEALSRRDFWVGDWLVRPSLARIERGPDAVHITPRSMAVLICLADAGGRVLSRNQLLDAVWPRMDVTQDALSQCIVELRKAFHDDAKRARVIETVPRLGVRLIGPVSDEPPAARQPRPDSAVAGAAEVLAHSADAPARPGNLLVRAGRVAAAPPVAVTGLVVATVGIAAFWFTQDSAPPRRDPLAGADFARVTDFIGAEEHAAISPDGRLVAFVSDRDGAWDVWLGQIGTGDFQNLTQGQVPELRNPAVRMLQFSPGGTDVRIWTKTTDAVGDIVDHGWIVPVVGGGLRRDVEGISELDWSPDGEWIVYHPSAPGDPLFVMAADDKGGGRQIYVAPPGIHCHFPLWSHDGKSIYFVRGLPPDEMDLWRIDTGGGTPERLTQHHSRVSFPVLLDERTLLYLATAADGSGPWLYALDLERRKSRRVKAASHPLTSIAASSDARRIVATEARPTATLWRVSLGDAMASAADIEQISLPTQRTVSPRIGPGFVVYRAPKAGTDGLWRREGSGAVTELWSGADGRVVAGPALTADGQRLAFVVQRQGQMGLHVINADGSAARKVADEFEVHGAPAWSPDGEWIAVAAIRDGEPRLFKLPSTGEGPPIALGDDYALDPVWSPSGRFLAYTGRDVGTVMPLKAINADGTPHALPELFLSRGSRRLDFLGDDDGTLVILKGALSHKEFWAIDLASGVERELTELGPGALIGDFDVSHDGRALVFDRVRDESDIVRIDLAGR
jgi:Tol biopolymer transport system component/DNA-binding winged helix-turn-helix (wHTH) protein